MPTQYDEEQIDLTDNAVHPFTAAKISPAAGGAASMATVQVRGGAVLVLLDGHNPTPLGANDTINDGLGILYQNGVSFDISGVANIAGARFLAAGDHPKLVCLYYQ